MFGETEQRNGWLDCFCIDHRIDWRRLALLLSWLAFDPFAFPFQTVGKVHKMGRDYVGMLVLGVFNATVPLKSIPKQDASRVKLNSVVRFKVER